MRTRIVFTCFCVCILLSACISQEPPKVPAVEETSTPSVIQETPISVSQTETETTQSKNCQLQIIQLSGADSPIFVFLQKNTLMIQIGENTAEPVGDFTDLGIITDALLIGENLNLLRESGIQQIHLVDCTSDILGNFDVPISSGKLILDIKSSRIFYNGVITEPRDTLIGYYDITGISVHSILSYKEPLVTLQIIGLTEDGQGLYCLPHGQDPDFGKILLVNIDLGAISRELPVRGYNYAVLSPDSRHLATSAQVIDASGQLENMINIYDLPSLPLTSPKYFKLPIPTSMIGNNGFYWSPDGKGLFFMLVENKEDPSTSISDGMWVLDVEIGSMHKLADIHDPNLQISGVSPDGSWLLVRSTTNDEAFLVDSQTGEVQSFSVPLNAMLAGWR